MTAAIIVFSSINQDEILTVERLPIRGETILSKSESYSVGGKGANIAIAAASALKDKVNQNVYMFGGIGNDEAGRLCKEKLRERGVNTDYVIEYKNISTGGATILLEEDTGENSIIVKSGANSRVEWNDYCKESQRLIEKSGCILAVNLEISAGQVELAMRDVKEKGGCVILNASPATQLCTGGWIGNNSKSKRHQVWDYVDYLIVNQVEALQIIGKEWEDEVEKEKKVWREEIIDLRKQLRLNNQACIVLTLGRNGLVYSERENHFTHLEGIKTERVVDTTAAGDTLLGYFCAQLRNCVDVEDGLRCSMKAATLCIETKGAANAIPCLEQLIDRWN